MTQTKRKPHVFDSYIYRVVTPDGTMYVGITEDHDGNPFEMFVSAGKSGTPLAAWAEVVASLVSHLWKCGTSSAEISRLLTTNYTPRYSTNVGAVKVYSGPNGIQLALTWYIQDVANRNLRKGLSNNLSVLPKQRT